jgi:hypothetical protein
MLQYAGPMAESFSGAVGDDGLNEGVDFADHGGSPAATNSPLSASGIQIILVVAVLLGLVVMFRFAFRQLLS